MGFLDKFKSKFEQIGRKQVRSKKEKTAAPAEAKEEKEGPKEEAPKEEQPTVVKKETGEAHRILIHSLVSEKTATLAGDGKYVFVVAPKADKIQVKNAVQAVYGTRPVDVNIITQRGKAVRFGRNFGKRKSIKKAIVTMPKGKTLPIYE